MAKQDNPQPEVNESTESAEVRSDAAAQAGEGGNSASPAQSTAAPAKQPSPVTLAELKLILESALDGQWEAGSYLK